MADWGTPTTGAYIITKDDADTALKEGKVTIESPLSYDEGKAGDVIYFQYSLTAPKRDTDGTPAQPAKDDDGNWTMDHLMVNGTPAHRHRRRRWTATTRTRRPCPSASSTPISPVSRRRPRTS